MTGRGRHRWAPLVSSAGSEKLVEQVAEPRLEYVDFGLSDRDAPGPIVDDPPGFDVGFDRPAEARPGFDLDVKIVGQNAEAGAVAAVFVDMGARSGHLDRIA
jgi:hypothetical protein